MSFLNGILAFGAAAFAVPLIIHILNRSRFRTIQWGAMHLLDSIVRVNHKRFRIEQLILLLVRCAIPVVLAFCFARPVLTGWRDLAGDAPVSAVILLDTSYSMDASSAEGKHLDLAVEQAIAMMKVMRRGSEVSVIQPGGRPTPVFDQPIFDPPLMIERLRQLDGGLGASQMPEALDLAFATLKGMSHARRELIVVSDFQSSDWTVSDNSFSQQIRAQVESADFPPSLTFLRVGQATTGNVSVDGLDLSRSALGVDQELLIRANLKNHGADPYEKARATLFVDGTEESVSQVDLDAGATTQVLFSYRFEAPGSHVLTVELAVDDPLATDNHAAAAINVWEQIGVVLVDGAPSSQPLQGEADFLAVALTPFTLGRLKLADLIQTKTIAVTELRADTVKGAQVVVLANVPKLSAEQLTDLTDYVRAGGSLLVFPGDRVDVAWYNDALFADRSGLLPLPFAEAIGVAGVDSTPARIVSQHFDHPALELFNEPANGDLSTAEIRRWYRLGQASAGAAADAPHASQNGPIAPGVAWGTRPQDLAELIVMARLDSGDPFLVQKHVDDGVVMQVATACDADWSDLPMRPIYLPLMQQLVVSMASQVAPPQNIATGEPIVAVFRNTSSEVPLSLTTPDGGRLTVSLRDQGGRSVARFLNTQRPGVYTLTSPDADPIHYVAESSRQESDLSLLDEPALVKLADEMQADIASSAADYLDRDRLRRHGREVWTFLWALVLALLFLELVLQQWFARARV